MTRNKDGQPMPTCAICGLRTRRFGTSNGAAVVGHLDTVAGIEADRDHRAKDAS